MDHTEFTEPLRPPKAAKRRSIARRADGDFAPLRDFGAIPGWTPSTNHAKNTNAVEGSPTGVIFKWAKPGLS